MSEGGAVVWVCQGSPRCLLEGDEAVAAMQAGCVWCDQIYFDELGNETRREGPGEQMQ